MPRAQTLASVAAVLQDAPTFRNREGNFVAAGDAGSKAAATGAEDLPASWPAAEAGDADVAQVPAAVKVARGSGPAAAT